MKQTLWLLVFAVCFSTMHAQNERAMNLVAGFRASRILESYPNQQFPSQNFWAAAGKLIAGKFTNATPASVWLVSIYQDGGLTQMNFPSNGLSLPNVRFESTDASEAYLTRLDAEGFKVWLQVEPGNANMDTLIYIVLNRYKQHPCVVGFGVDVEWYKPTATSSAKVTDAEAQRWEQKVKAINPNYTLFLKHYSPSWMPPTFRGDIFFIDDSQEFTSLNSMVSEFKTWGTKFSPNPVGFQFGYEIDSTWWKQYPDPMQKIGSTLLSNISNCKGVFWVDFTITKIFPITTDVKGGAAGARNFRLAQNYPNPFNPVTVLEYELPASGEAHLGVYDITGREVLCLAKEVQSAGMHRFEVNAGKLVSGVYIARLEFDGKYSVCKMTLIK